MKLSDLGNFIYTDLAEEGQIEMCCRVCRDLYDPQAHDPAWTPPSMHVDLQYWVEWDMHEGLDKLVRWAAEHNIKWHTEDSTTEEETANAAGDPGTA